MHLTQEDENKLKNLMLDFILRVFTTKNKSPEEVAILPEIIKLLLLNSKHKAKSSDSWSVTPLVDANGEIVSPLAKSMIRQLQAQQ